MGMRNIHVLRQKHATSSGNRRKSLWLLMKVNNRLFQKTHGVFIAKNFLEVYQTCPSGNKFLLVSTLGRPGTSPQTKWNPCYACIKKKNQARSKLILKLLQRATHWRLSHSKHVQLYFLQHENGDLG